MAPETLDPSPNEFVIRAAASDSLIARARVVGSLEPLEAAEPLCVLRVKGTASSKDAWHAALEALGPDTPLFPVLYDRDRSPHYPTGEVTVRFEAAPTDADLRRFCAEQRLRLLRRNEFAAQQVVCEPVAAASEFLPDLVARLATQPGVRTAWANTLSRYHRAEK
jgi:hypothetical protein